jgi:hypothetical protein
MSSPVASPAANVARPSQFWELISIGSTKEGFLSERNELAMYQSFSRKLSSHVGGTDRRIAAVQNYVSWSGDQQTKIGHRSNDTRHPERPFPNLVGFDWDRQVQASAFRN